MKTATNRREVKSEKLGFRDPRISDWHRRLGWDYPATDLDFPLLEYSAGVPKALIEYKHKNQPPMRRNHPTLRALSELCSRANLPFFVVRYNDDCTLFRVTAVNHRAKELIKQTTLMSDDVFKRFHWRLRNE